MKFYTVCIQSRECFKIEKAIASVDLPMRGPQAHFTRRGIKQLQCLWIKFGLVLGGLIGTLILN